MYLYVYDTLNQIQQIFPTLPENYFIMYIFINKYVSKSTIKQILFLLVVQPARLVVCYCHANASKIAKVYRNTKSLDSFKMGSGSYWCVSC